MEDIALILHAEKLFPYRPYLDPLTVEILRDKYIKARQYLGDKWILAR